MNDENIVKDAQRWIGNVSLSHKNIIMTCDSAWVYSKNNTVDAFSNVHIISNDTLDLWADKMNYNTDSGFTKARKNVKMKDPSLTLTTDSLDFDMNDEIGYYNYGGTIVDSTNTLTSQKGTYYTKTHNVKFVNNVWLTNEEYNMRTDTLLYNTNTEIATFEGPTNIVGDSTHIYSTSGWFDTKSNESELHKNSTIKRGETQLQANYIYYNDNSGDGNAAGNVIINDYKNQMIIAGNKAVYSDFNKYAMVTDSALWIQYYEADSLFLHADTLYTIPDTTAEGEKLLITYNHVRFYRTDLQGISDSLIYFTKDSTIQLYIDPVIWSMENQMSANFIELINNSVPPNKVYLNDNAFIIQQVDSVKFNQIKGKNMVGLIKDQLLYRIDVKGNGQSIYYPADDEDYIGLNKAESSNIILYLASNQINRITFVGAPVGNMKPLLETVSPDSQLDGFKWRKDERPTSRFDIFDDQDEQQQPSVLPSTEITNRLPDLTTIKKEFENSDKLMEIIDSAAVLLDSIAPLKEIQKELQNGDRMKEIIDSATSILDSIAPLEELQQELENNDQLKEMIDSAAHILDKVIPIK